MASKHATYRFVAVALHNSRSVIHNAAAIKVPCHTECTSVQPMRGIIIYTADCNVVDQSFMTHLPSSHRAAVESHRAPPATRGATTAPLRLTSAPIRRTHGSSN